MYVHIIHVVISIDMKCRPNALVFLDNNIVAVGGESSMIQVQDVELEKSIWIFNFSVRAAQFRIHHETDSGSQKQKVW